MTRLLAAVLALAVIPSAAAVSAPLRFSGRTAARMPIAFRVSADGRRLDRLSLGYSVYCDDDIGFAGSATRTGPVRVARDGTFAAEIHSRALERIDARVVVRGRVSGRRASGTVRAWLMPANGPNCVSPDVPWNARAGA